MELKDKVTLVTGGAHRVGKAIALELARAGAHVVVHYHSAGAAVLDTVAEIEALGVRALPVQADLGAEAGIKALFAAAEAEFHGLDVLINSAAGMEGGDVRTLTRAAWQSALDLNLTAPFFCAQAAVRLMAGRPGAAIVNIGDLAGLEPWTRYPAHSVSKAGLAMVTLVLAKALAPEIRVNAVAPGPVMKPQGWDDARWHEVGQHTLLKRTGSGYDVGRAVRFLLESEFITGETLVIDGGRLIA
jgi:pteridine reductase